MPAMLLRGLIKKHRGHGPLLQSIASRRLTGRRAHA